MNMLDAACALLQAELFFPLSFSVSSVITLSSLRRTALPDLRMHCASESDYEPPHQASPLLSAQPRIRRSYLTAQRTGAALKGQRRNPEASEIQIWVTFIATEGVGAVEGWVSFFALPSSKTCTDHSLNIDNLFT